MSPAPAGRPERRAARGAPGSGLAGVMAEARRRGFVGPTAVDAQLAHAVGFAAGLPSEPRRALDLGSGGGLPGLALAEHWPGSTWVLLEAREGRAAFLADAVGRLGLQARVEVRWGRAERLGRATELRGAFDAVVSRGFGAPAVVAECAAPFLRVGGRLVVSEPPGGAAARWHDLADVDLGLAAVGVVAGPAGSYQVLVQRSLCSDRYPRREGVPRRRPLF